MAKKTHSAQMEEGRLATAADIVGGLARGSVGIVDIKRVAVKIPQARTVLETGGDPSCRGRCRDADAIVLVDKKQRQGGWIETRSSLRC